MLVIPAVDLMGGRAVRLRQGRKDERTDYYDDPVLPAAAFVREGARFIHVVDLDGAFEGGSKNLESVRRIVEAAGPEVGVELGGGIRTLEQIGSALALGVRRVILGTAALTDPDLPGLAVERFGAERIVLGLDASGGQVAIRGWEEVTGRSALDLAREAARAGVKRLIYTDIARDGMLTGPNLPALERMARDSGLAVIASGGIASLENVRAVAALEGAGVEGLIIGKALYEGRFTLAEAIAAAGAQNTQPERS
jgi:phosphoribosylformimino-5-aminoimidazole carboxamide ribotide isomerase